MYGGHFQIFRMCCADQMSSNTKKNRTERLVELAGKSIAMNLLGALR